VDLHVHSQYSEPSADWFMQHSGISESYSDPSFIYEKAKEAGMSLVTITDHNSIDGCLELKERYGNDVLMGVETTASFPEDKCKIHLLIYGLSETDFVEIQRLRRTYTNCASTSRKEAWPTPLPMRHTRWQPVH